MKSFILPMGSALLEDLSTARDKRARGTVVSARLALYSVPTKQCACPTGYDSVTYMRSFHLLDFLLQRFIKRSSEPEDKIKRFV